MPEISPSRFMIQAGWDDVPHLTEKTKKDLLNSTPPFLRDARSKGIPSLGAGAIYPIQLEEVSVKPFAIPRHWKKGYALDVGWNRTAALWGAQNPNDGVIYCYAEHYRGQAEPVIHATAIKARGAWIKGAIDPASRGRSQKDGEQLFEAYENQGLNLVPALNGVESGLYVCWEGLSLGRIKIFTTLQNFAAEYRLYRRDEHGKIIKKHDHLMDTFRYLIVNWDQIAAVQAPERYGDMGSGISDTTAGY
ncbi:hypothetical protein DYI37_03845 [Fulvimarina endophytica]|uniref:Terminase large subunit gp17-like C-terminal domain-containing protein n=1 Tax=Fulvimarina endophytica TaxID=2293836 RepID=A0A371X708_9HYPH|nr:hypothetical protein [Fulvimarina endophytica]RFC65008.1 hypothetical protein DYI37_03845 [Fulvimarina endophytica]